ncbi:hypothetical protein AK812_SmicGene15828 [Symbiodinium microadriaticum]|uniref:Uncharacterized protein n=1 Tax=Symbiodinium microadriaticum TaxID=2951 RepID=A0A1Q9E1X7_SYMMI|nr:hypothetical protein AK812_SmicGene15828 [Symbiodinium microadriaticum]
MKKKTVTVTNTGYDKGYEDGDDDDADDDDDDDDDEEDEDEEAEPPRLLVLRLGNFGLMGTLTLKGKTRG